MVVSREDFWNGLLAKAMTRGARFEDFNFFN